MARNEILLGILILLAGCGHAVDPTVAARSPETPSSSPSGGNNTGKTGAVVVTQTTKISCSYTYNSVPYKYSRTVYSDGSMALTCSFDGVGGSSNYTAAEVTAAEAATTGFALPTCQATLGSTYLFYDNYYNLSGTVKMTTYQLGNVSNFKLPFTVGSCTVE